MGINENYVAPKTPILKPKVFSSGQTVVDDKNGHVYTGIYRLIHQIDPVKDGDSTLQFAIHKTDDGHFRTLFIKHDHIEGKCFAYHIHKRYKSEEALQSDAERIIQLTGYA